MCRCAYLTRNGDGLIYSVFISSSFIYQNSFGGLEKPPKNVTAFNVEVTAFVTNSEQYIYRVFQKDLNDLNLVYFTY